MNAKWKAKWVKALRSGKYRQGQDQLLYSGRYCCLGVLRSVMHKGSRKGDKDKELLCKEHETEAGLTYEQQDKLAAMNDMGRSFSEIADYIERNL